MGVIFKSKLTSVASNTNFRIDHRYHNYVENEAVFKSFPFSRFISENGFELQAKNDYRFIENFYKLMLNHFGGYKP